MFKAKYLDYYNVYAFWAHFILALGNIVSSAPLVERSLGSQEVLVERPKNVPDINYNHHPFEIHQRKERNLQVDVDLTLENEKFKPLRLVFDTSQISDILMQEKDTDRQVKLRVLMDEVLPQVTEIWGSTLSVIPVEGELKIGMTSSISETINVVEGTEIGDKKSVSQCPGFGDEDPPHLHTSAGVSNADTIIYVNVDHSLCNSDDPPPLPFGNPCELDQYDRPIAGLLDFCIERITLNREGNVSKAEFTATVNSIVRETAHILGMNTELFKFFRNAVTGDPLTERPFTIAETQCLDPQVVEFKPKIACNTLKVRKQSNGIIYYEVVTPTVRQVVRNQLDCPIMTGARLENQGHRDDCYGSHWEQRLHFSEMMSNTKPATESVLSPLTLALFEDSGWYKANYQSEYVSVNQFGHGAGCDFITKPCIGPDDSIPNHSKGFFCNDEMYYTSFGTLTGEYGCDASHNSKAWCDLVDYSDNHFSRYNKPPPRHFRNFKNPNLGSFNYRTDYCPVALTEESIKCSNEEEKPLFQDPLEYYGSGSKCMNVIRDSRVQPLCVKTECYSDLLTQTRTLLVSIGSNTYSCSRDFLTFDLPDNAGVLECPRLLAACPELGCPKNCSGKGTCKIDAIGARCQCFDPTDTTEGCYNTMISQPIVDTSLCGDKPGKPNAATNLHRDHSSILYFIILFSSVVTYYGLMFD